MAEKANQRIQFYVTPSQAKAMDNGTKKAKCTQSDLIRRALQRYLAEIEIDFPMPDIKEGRPKSKGAADQ